MESEKTMNEQESLKVIHEMISSAKNTIKDDGTLYLMWGWLVLLSSIGHYLILTLTNFEYPYIVWVSMPLAGIFTGIFVSKQVKKQKVKTHLDEMIGYLWLAFMVSLFIILIFMPKIGYSNTYPLLIILYGIGTFVSGGALRFKPLIIGGALNWLIAVVAFLVPFEQQLLLLGLAVICSYIVPGYWLKKTYKP